MTSRYLTFLAESLSNAYLFNFHLECSMHAYQQATKTKGKTPEQATYRVYLKSEMSWICGGWRYGEGWRNVSMSALQRPLQCCPAAQSSPFKTCSQLSDAGVWPPASVNAASSQGHRAATRKNKQPPSPWSRSSVPFHQNTCVQTLFPLHTKFIFYIDFEKL